MLNHQGKPIPSGLNLPLQAAHILPVSLNKFQAASELVGLDILSLSNIWPAPQHNAAIAWDMLRSWTGIDVAKAAGSKINAPENAILMTSGEHKGFGRFLWYLDKDAVSCLFNLFYLSDWLIIGSILIIQTSIRGSLLNYQFSTREFSYDVEFWTEHESGVKLPDPEFIKIHAAFAHVLYESGAGQYFTQVEYNAKELGELSADGKSDLALLLIDRLANWFPTAKAHSLSYVDIEV